MEPTVRNFIASLKSFLTQYDMKLSVRHPNNYRLAHFLQAADDVEAEMSGQLDNSSRSALEDLTASIAKNFEDFPPRRKIFKQIREYIESGKLPQYGGVKKGKGSAMAASKVKGPRVKLTKSEKDFIYFLEETLIPDLKESGSEGYVDDFEEGLDYLEYYEEHGVFPRGGGPKWRRKGGVEDYLDYLHNTIIPDSIEGGWTETAKDLKRMAKMVERRLGPGGRQVIEG